MVPKIAGSAKPALPTDHLPNNAYSADEPASPRARVAAAAHTPEAPATRAPGLLTRFVRAVDGTNRREKQRGMLQAELARLENGLSGTLLKAWGDSELLKSGAERLQKAINDLYQFETTQGSDETAPSVEKLIDKSALAGHLVRFINDSRQGKIYPNHHQNPAGALTSLPCFLRLAYPSIDFSSYGQRTYEDFVKTLTTDALTTLCEGNGELAWQQGDSSNKPLFEAATDELAARKATELLKEYIPEDLAKIAAGYVA